MFLFFSFFSNADLKTKQDNIWDFVLILVLNLNASRRLIALPLQIPTGRAVSVQESSGGEGAAAPFGCCCGHVDIKSA